MHATMFASALVSAWVVAAPLAQKTLVVGPGGFKEIKGAIAQAQPGDTILVHGGTYQHFALDRGVTIRAMPQAVVVVFEKRGPRANFFLIPSGQRAEVIGLQFDFQLPFNIFNRYTTEVRGGKIAFRRCKFVSSAAQVPGYPALDISDADVVLRDCEILGQYGGVGLRATRARVAATRTNVLGGPGFWDSAAFGGAAIELSNSRLHATHVTVTGGPVPFINPFYDGGHGLHVTGTASRVWIADSRIHGGEGGKQPGNRGGDGLRNESGHAVMALRTTATGGLGTISGLAVRGPWNPTASLLSIRASSGPDLGGRFDVDFRAPSNSAVVVFASPRFDRVDTTALREPLWLDLNGIQVVASSGAGAFRVSLPIPNLPSLRGASLWLVGVANTPPPFAASPPVGGQIR